MAIDRASGRRWAKRIGAGILLLLGIILVAGVSYQWVATRRDLKALLDSGLGGSFVDWSLVQPEVAAFTQVCSYDRAGLGYSDRGPSPRTAQQISNELAHLLVNAGIDGKVVLVGASLGGFNIVRTTRRQLNAPVIVISAGRNADAEWRAFQQDQVRLAERGCQIIAEGSGHVIPLSQPQTVVKAIRSMVDAARNRAEQRLCG